MEKSFKELYDKARMLKQRERQYQESADARGNETEQFVCPDVEDNFPAWRGELH